MASASAAGIALAPAPITPKGQLTLQPLDLGVRSVQIRARLHEFTHQIVAVLLLLLAAAVVATAAATASAAMAAAARGRHGTRRAVGANSNTRAFALSHR